MGFPILVRHSDSKRTVVNSNDVLVRSLFERIRLPLPDFLVCGSLITAPKSGVLPEIVETVGMIVNSSQDITDVVHKVGPDDGLRRRLF